MSEKLKIKLSIANRVYPLTIDSKQEEGLRKAAQKIDAMIKQFEQSYSVRDKQDVLAMCALQFASQKEQKEIDTEYLNEEVEEKLNAMNQLLEEYLDSYVLLNIIKVTAYISYFFDELNVNSLKKVS